MKVIINDEPISYREFNSQYLEDSSFVITKVNNTLTYNIEEDIEDNLRVLSSENNITIIPVKRGGATTFIGEDSICIGNIFKNVKTDDRINKIKETRENIRKVLEELGIILDEDENQNTIEINNGISLGGLGGEFIDLNTVRIEVIIFFKEPLIDFRDNINICGIEGKQNTYIQKLKDIDYNKFSILLKKYLSNI